MSEPEKELRAMLAAPGNVADEVFVQAVVGAIERYERRRTGLTVILSVIAVGLTLASIYGLTLALDDATFTGLAALTLGPLLLVSFSTAIALAVRGADTAPATADASR